MKLRKNQRSILYTGVLLFVAVGLGWSMLAAAQDRGLLRAPEATTIIIRENTDETSSPRRAQDSEHIIHGTAGGPVRATQYGISPSGPCMGWIPEKPQHTFTLTTQSIVRIRTQSTTDTTMVIRGHYGNDEVLRCRDDDDGSNPGLNDTLPPGEYELYLGAWNGGTLAPFTLRIEIQNLGDE